MTTYLSEGKNMPLLCYFRFPLYFPSSTATLISAGRALHMCTCFVPLRTGADFETAKQNDQGSEKNGMARMACGRPSLVLLLNILEGTLLGRNN